MPRNPWMKCKGCGKHVRQLRSDDKCIACVNLEGYLLLRDYPLEEDTFTKLIREQAEKDKNANPGPSPVYIAVLLLILLKVVKSAT